MREAGRDDGSLRGRAGERRRSAIRRGHTDRGGPPSRRRFRADRASRTRADDDAWTPTSPEATRSWVHRTRARGTRPSASRPNRWSRRRGAAPRRARIGRRRRRDRCPPDRGPPRRRTHPSPMRRRLRRDQLGVAVSAPSAFTRPSLTASPLSAGTRSDPESSAFFSWSAPEDGKWARTRAATPATCGDAKDVPLPRHVPSADRGHDVHARCEEIDAFRAVVGEVRSDVVTIARSRTQDVRFL